MIKPYPPETAPKTGRFLGVIREHIIYAESEADIPNVIKRMRDSTQLAVVERSDYASKDGKIFCRVVHDVEENHWDGDWCVLYGWIELPEVDFSELPEPKFE